MAISFSYAHLVKRVHRKVFRLLLKPLLSPLFYYLPVKKNRICFANFSGKGYGDNPKYIAEEIHFRKKSYELCWLLDNLLETDFPEYIRVVKIDSVEALFIRATSKIWINNIRNDNPIRKKKNQLYLQTWHAPYALKLVEAEAEKRLNKKYVSQAKYDGYITDGILANSRQQAEQFKRAFWLNKCTEILKFGLPRNDFLIMKKGNTNEVMKLKRKLCLNYNSYYILFAPTFRDDFSLDGYKLDFGLLLKAFKNKLNLDVKIIIRLHPNVAFQSRFIHYNDSESIINGSNFPDIQVLSVVCDCLITDYSSALFDFVLLHKPVFICALDLDAYEKKRGLEPEFYKLPFPIAKTSEQLVTIIENFDESEYFKKVDTYFSKNELYDDGYATERTVDWIMARADKLC